VSDEKKPASEALYGSKSRSTPQKITMQLLSWCAVAAVAWFEFAGGREVVAGWFGTSWPAATPTRAALLFACSTIYAARLVVTQFYLIKRTMPWSECATISVWLWVIHSTMIGFGGTNAAPISVVTWIGLALYGLGSYLNTGSEVGLHVCKLRPENKGKLYTEGLFAYSMHINFFGDFTLFTGFALVSGVVWTAAVPLIMASLFLFVNIPMLDEYLAKRYVGQFEAYAAKTKKFFPFVY